MQGLTFPNNQTPLGRFLKRALREQIPLSTLTHHVLFSLHRWEFAPWIADMLSKNYGVIVERFAWSGTVYSWASDVSKDPHSYMVLDAGLPQPDLVTPFSEVLQRGGIALSLFVDVDFQQNLRTCYADPRMWKGINVLVHETQTNRWASRKSLVRRIQGEALLRSEVKPWCYLWEEQQVYQFCSFDVSPQQPVFRCFRCTELIHYVCLMENSASQKVPICQACGTPTNRTNPTSAQGNEALSPIEVSTALSPENPDQDVVESPNVELRDPYLNPLEEIVLDTGSLPCAKHGYDHLSRDPACEFCKRAIGPLYRHLSKKYGISLGYHTPTLSFDFSGPHPVAVTGARFMLLFVWRLDTVRLLWAFAVVGKTKGMCSILFE